jgi:transcriptional regulator with XRE-family HTH domain
MKQTVGERLLEAAERKGWSADQFAKLVGVSYETVRKWRTGATAPNRNRAIKVAEVLGTSVNWVMYGEGQQMTTTSSDDRAALPPPAAGSASHERHALAAATEALLEAVAQVMASASEEQRQAMHAGMGKYLENFRQALRIGPAQTEADRGPLGIAEGKSKPTESALSKPSTYRKPKRDFAPIDHAHKTKTKRRV